VFEIFGTYPSTATASEKTLSQTMEAIVANFARNPATGPAPNWPKYVPGNTTTTLAKLAYNGNVALANVMQAAGSNSLVRSFSLLTAVLIADSTHRTHPAILCGIVSWTSEFESEKYM
jgi:hypothetical protein